jgi:hypothetical protein
MSNPNPTPPPVDKQFQPGVSGNPAGRPKGITSFANVVRKVMADKTLLDSVAVAKNQKWIKNLPDKNIATAIIVAMVVKALEGDPRAFDNLRKAGYGDKLDITTDGEKIPVPILGGLSLAPVKSTPKPAVNTPAPVKPSAPKGATPPVAGIVAKPPVVATNKPQVTAAPTANKPVVPKSVSAPAPQQPPKQQLSPAQQEARNMQASLVVPPNNGK